MEQAGAVFLPSSGDRERDGSTINKVGSLGDYWTSTHFEDYAAYDVDFENGIDVNIEANLRCYGHSVRLVKDVN